MDNKLQIVVKSETKFLTVETLEIPEVSFVSIRNIIDVKQANDLIGKFGINRFQHFYFPYLIGGA